MSKLYLILQIIMLSMMSSLAQFAMSGAEEVKSEVELILEDKKLTPGESHYLLLKITYPKGWYSYYYNNTASKTICPTIKFEPIDGVQFGQVEYSIPQIKESYGIPSYVYPNEVILRTQITLDPNVTVGTSLEIRGKAKWQICEQSCVNEQADLSLDLKVGEAVSSGLATVPMELSFSLSENIVATVEEKENGYELKVEGEFKPVTFYDLDGQTQFQSAEIIERNGDVATLFLPFDKGNSFRQSLVKPLPVLRGYLLDESKRGVWVELDLANEASIAKAPPEPEAEIKEKGKVEQGGDFSMLYNPEVPISYRTLKNSAPITFWFALSGAFLGGILLNLMPCVFPVLSLKVLSFIEKSGEDPWKIRLHGLLFTAGVILSMWVLVGSLFAIKHSTGQSINWGQQMGDPRFVAGIIIILFLFGLNMAGVFELGNKLTALGGAKGSKNDYLATIFSGVLTTVVATPCSGPFLGAAMGYTLEQSLPSAMVIFTVFALGISFPYLLLSFFPQLTSKMPRPGLWMDTLKKILSFGMFAAAAFFMQTFGAQTGDKGLSLLVMALVIVALASYMYGHWTPPHLKKHIRYGLGFTLSLLVLIAGLNMSWNAATKYKASIQEVTDSPHKNAIKWKAWTPGIVEYYRATGKYVWVDYTASWCATCIVNKKRIFGDEELMKSLNEEKIVFVKADLTDNDPTVSRDLSRVSRVQIPVNLLYAPELETPAVLLEELVSPSDAKEALDIIGYD